MKRPAARTFAALLGLAGALAAGAAGGGAAQAEDLGVRGKLFPVIETDILELLKAKLEAARVSGKVDALNRAFAERSMKTVNRPPAVPGLTATREPRSWLYDPSYTVPHDLADQQGRVFARAGQSVNPLMRTPAFDRVMVFIDGDDPRQVAYGLNQLHRYGAARARLILVKGSPIELMRREKTAIYYDQMGLLTDRLRLQQVPAIVQREGDRLRISEVKP